MSARVYLGIAEPGPHNWSLSFPAFPGAVTTGETFTELLANGSAALASVIEAMQQDGEPVPDSYDGPAGSPNFDLGGYRDPHLVVVPVETGGRSLRINVTMDEGLVARVDRFAERVHTSRSAILARGARLVIASETPG